MVLKIKHFVIFSTILLFFSCRDILSVTQIKGKQIEIAPTVQASNSIEKLILPYRERIDAVLDSTLAYAPITLSKTDDPYNTSIGNLLADLVFSEANPVFKSRTNADIDFVLLNHGGVRSIISKGNISERNAFEVMPFENAIVVAELSAKTVEDMVVYLKDYGRPHPISGLQIVLDKENGVRSIRVQGLPLNKNRTYNVATSDYLLNGGDDMVFFTDALHVTNIDYKIRNAIIDYFKKVDTVAAKVDDRFYRME